MTWLNITLLAVMCFAAGIITGIIVCRIANRQDQRERGKT